MSDLDIYLRDHYLNLYQFASSCGITVEKVNELIQQKLIPAPSYVVTDTSTLKSHIFGEMEAPGSIPGAYFHPMNRTWVSVALSIEDSIIIKNRFIQNFSMALAELNKNTWRLTDCFTETGSAIPAGIQARTESAWEHFLHGTFGLCVSDPSTEASIARKEVLQEKLTAISKNGTEIPSGDTDRRDLLELVDQYEFSSMPFSPIEYPRTSRKRLVNDLKERLTSV